MTVERYKSTNLSIFMIFEKLLGIIGILKNERGVENCWSN